MNRVNVPAAFRSLTFMLSGTALAVISTLVSPSMVAQEHSHKHAYPQTKTELQQQSVFFGGDTLTGFDWKKHINIAFAKFTIPQERLAYMRYRERDFVKKKYKIKMLPDEIWAANHKKQVPHVMAGTCSSIDFEAGNYGSWTGGIGYNANSNQPLTITTPAITTLGNNSPENSCSYHTIVDAAAGNDPTGGFPMLCPSGGVFSCRLGGSVLNTALGTCANQSTGAQSNGETMETQFVVTAGNCLFTYHYAVVLNDGGHLNGEQPFFSCQVLDGSGNPIPCLNYYVQAQNGSYPPGFVSVGGTGYLPWTATSLNLEPYIGQTVTIIFTAAGCIFGGHYGYAYVDIECGPMELLPPAAICPGGTAQMVAPGNGGGTYQWAGPGIVGSSTSQTVTVSAGGTYSVTMTNAAGCSYTLDTLVSVVPGPTITANNPTGCVGSQVNLTAQGASTYTWTPTTGLSSPTGSSIQATVGSTTVYTVTGADASGCQGTTTATVTAMPVPSVALNNMGPYCPGDVVPTATFTPNPNDPTTSYQWSNNNPSIGLAATGVGITPSFTTTANSTLSNIYSVVTVTPTLNGCVGTPNSYTITVKPTPLVVPGPDLEFCPNVTTNQVSFTCLPSGGSPTFFWTNLNTNIGLGSSGSGNLPGFTTVNTGSTAVSATILVHASLDNCPGPDSILVLTVNPNPVPKFSYSSACIGEPTTLTDASWIGQGNVTNWNWDVNNDGFFLDATNPNPTFTFTPAGPHQVGLSVTSNKGCKSQVYQTIYINYLPTPAFTGDNLAGCPVHQTIFSESSTAVAPSQLVDWSWDFGNGQSSVSQQPTPVLFSNNSPTLPIYYDVTLTVKTDSGCSASITKNNYIMVYPQPIAGFGWDPVDADILDPTIYFFNTSVGGSGNLPIEYYLGDVFIGQQDPNNWTNLTNPIYTYNDHTPYTYYVTQWVKNVYGCRDSITHPVTIHPAYTFYIPNAFTPNGDGRNEGFKGTGIGIDTTTYNLWIFDRWGNQVFHSLDLEETWNGRFNDVLVQEDVYVWKVRFSDIAGVKHEFNGIVSVIR